MESEIILDVHMWCYYGCNITMVTALYMWTAYIQESEITLHMHKRNFICSFPAIFREIIMISISTQYDSV